MYEDSGLSRISGEIGALLYLYKGKMSLNEISEFLAISKGSASTNTRYLMKMKFIRPVRVVGDRKDYYEFAGDLWPAIQEYVDSVVRNQVNDYKRMNEKYLGELEQDSSGNNDAITQRKHLIKQLNALNTVYKYIDIARNLSKMFQVTPVSKAVQIIKKLVRKKIGGNYAKRIRKH